MRPDRLESLASEVWAFVFDLLDIEPGWTGTDAGRVGAVARRAFEVAVRAIGPERGPQRGAALFCEFCGAGPECIVCGRGRP